MARLGGEGKYIDPAADRRFAERPLPSGQWVGSPGGVEVAAAIGRPQAKTESHRRV